GDGPYWSSFLIVDGRSGWVLETSGRSWVAQPVGDGAAISNRLTLTTGWTRSSPDVAPGTNWDERRAPDAPTGIPHHPLAATRASVAPGPDLTPADLVAPPPQPGTRPRGPAGAAAAPPPPPPREAHDDGAGDAPAAPARGRPGRLVGRHGVHGRAWLPVHDGVDGRRPAGGRRRAAPGLGHARLRLHRRLPAGGRPARRGGAGAAGRRPRRA